MTEKETLLKFTPQEWDWWLTQKADLFSDTGGRVDEILFGPQCLFCLAYDGPGTKVKDSGCNKCMPGKSDGDFWPCKLYPSREKIDAAIERLERAGVFDD